MKINYSYPFKTLSLLLLAAILNLAIACNYYKIHTLNQVNDEITKANLTQTQKEKRYIVLHCSGTYHIYDIELDQSAMTMRCIKEGAPYSVVYNPDHPGNMKYHLNDSSKKVLDEVHIFASNYKILDSSKIEIPLSAISRIDVVEKDSGRTTASYVGATIGIIAGVFVIILIIALLTKSSCPFIYVKDGQHYVFKGELFGGAIFKPLERDDFIALNSIQQGDSIYNIKISNELKEKQYTDIAELIVAERNGANTAIDSKGVVHSIKEPVSPRTAMLNEKDYRAAVTAIDSNSCIFNEQQSVNDLLMTFKKPAGEDHAKLILNAKNSLWLDFAFGKLTELFGMAYGSWIQKQRTANRDTLMEWSNKQNLPLSVYVKKNDQWQLVEHIPTIGPLASRNLCVPIDLSGINSDKVEIKLSCGFMFWEVDYAAMDFSKDEVINAHVLKPAFAKDEAGKDLTKELSSIDGDYLFQPGPGYETSISYRLPTLEKGKQYDVYLHTRGFYEHIRNYTGLPDKKLLESFKREGAFTNFSRMLYNQLNSNISVAL